MAVCAAGKRGVGPGVKRRFLCNISGVLVCRNSLLVYRNARRRARPGRRTRSGCLSLRSDLRYAIFRAREGGEGWDESKGRTSASCFRRKNLRLVDLWWPGEKFLRLREKSLGDFAVQVGIAP